VRIRVLLAAALAFVALVATGCGGYGGGGGTKTTPGGGTTTSGGNGY
jgi:hypothetical protein